MGKIHRNIIKSTSEYTRSFQNLRGMDLRAGSCEERYGFLENMYVDYLGGANAVESIPGFRRLYSFGKKINGLHKQNIGVGEEFLIIHAGNDLYRISTKDRDSLKNLTPIGSLSDRKSHSFSFGKKLYVMDGDGGMIQIDEEGKAQNLGDSGALPHIPTIYKDAKAFESRNMLTEKFKESYKISDPEFYSYATKNLNYIILDEEARTAAISGAASTLYGALYIPSYIKIGDKRYKVIEIMPFAFKDQVYITSLFLRRELKTVGALAFFGCSSLKEATVSLGVERIGKRAFGNCSSLETIYLGVNLHTVEEDAFSGCEKLSYVKYEGDEASFDEVSGTDLIGTGNIYYGEQNEKIRLAFPALGPIMDISRAKIQGKSVTYIFDGDNKEILIDLDSPGLAMGAELIFEGRLYPTVSSENESADDFLMTEQGRRVGPAAAILGCTVSEVFDGRVFLSGNPALAGVVFYSSAENATDSTPLYFSSKDYFIDGVGNYPITDLLSAHGSIAVMKSGDDGSGSIFYHSKNKDNTTGKDLYPCVYTHGGVAALGGAYNFFDDAVFLSNNGVCALEKSNDTDYREVEYRSQSVNSMLTKENLECASVTEWMGYLVYCFGERFYLADSRGSFKENGKKSYEWYLLSGIGAYKNDTRVYRYAAFAQDGYHVSKNPDNIAQGVIMSEADERGNTVYYVNEDEKKICVYPTEEYTGGDFDAAVCAIGQGELLFFGTSGGELCVFNNDKRGVVPDRLISGSSFSYKDYKEVMGDKIHSDFYSFCGHRVRYSAATGWDDCGIPYLRKNTVRGSTIIKLKNFEGTTLSCELGLDMSEYKNLGSFSLLMPSFEDFNFSSLSFTGTEYSTLPVKEEERGWTEKRLTVYSQEFCSPFGIHSINYRYKIKGKIKE